MSKKESIKEYYDRMQMFNTWKEAEEYKANNIKAENWNDFLEKINSIFQFIFDLFFMFISIGTTFIFGLALTISPKNNIIFWLFLGNLIIMIKLCYIYFKHSEKKQGDD